MGRKGEETIGKERGRERLRGDDVCGSVSNDSSLKLRGVCCKCDHDRSNDGAEVGPITARSGAALQIHHDP